LLQQQYYQQQQQQQWNSHSQQSSYQLQPEQHVSNPPSHQNHRAQAELRIPHSLSSSSIGAPKSIPLSVAGAAASIARLIESTESGISSGSVAAPVRLRVYPQRQVCILIRYIVHFHRIGICDGCSKNKF
jgi:hypothetical protein